jgi:hypothetical protein
MCELLLVRHRNCRTGPFPRPGRRCRAPQWGISHSGADFPVPVFTSTERERRVSFAASRYAICGNA